MILPTLYGEAIGENTLPRLAELKFPLTLPHWLASILKIARAKCWGKRESSFLRETVLDQLERIEPAIIRYAFRLTF